MSTDDAKRDSTRGWRSVVTALLLLIWAAGALGLRSALRAKERRSDDLRARLEQTTQSAAEVRDLRREVALLRRHADRANGPLEAWREIALNQPEEVTLTSLSYRDTDGMKAAGEASDVNGVYTFKAALDKSRLFTRVALDGPRRNAQRNRECFELTLAIPGGAK